MVCLYLKIRKYESELKVANNPWFRVWGDMANDPKWRTIARTCEQKIGDVLSVYLHMMTLASNATERGRTQGFKDEDVATALDLRTDQVEAIRSAMQGRVLDGDYLTGWEKRQPLREDGSAERGKQHREMEKLKKELDEVKKELMQTLENATEHKRTQSTAREEKIREDKKEGQEQRPAQAPPGSSSDPVGQADAESGEKRKLRRGTPEDERCARWCYGHILNVLPSATEPNWALWSDDVRLIRERDQRSHHDICELFAWATKDNFWCRNILSPSALRKQWDKLTIAKSKAGTSSSSAKPSIFDATMEAAASAKKMIFGPDAVMGTAAIPPRPMQSEILPQGEDDAGS